MTSQAALSFTGRAARLHSPDLSDGDEITADPNDTIIAATPIKPHTAGRNFKVLFNDSLSNGEKRPASASSSRTKAASPASAVLGMKRERSRALTPSSDEDDDWSVGPKLKSLEASAAMPVKQSQSRTRTVNGKPTLPRALVPLKDNLWSEVGPTKASQAKPALANSRRTGFVAPRVPNKRSSPDDVDDHDTPSTAATGYPHIPLLPPSPPPPDSSTSLKGKAKAVPVGRKKAKLLHDAGSGGEDSLEDEVQVREIDPLAHLPHADREVDPDSDWEAHWRSRTESDDPAISADPGKFDVNLPDELQRILAISPGADKRETEEERVVRELLYGSRETHYDPSKGGEIWDVGEDPEHAEGTEEEWEGEPVPWEVGEL